jgi:hemerythrin superfamily protein
MPVDIREQLRRDHAKALAELAAVGEEPDARRAQARPPRLANAWMIHALAEETVVYRALEGGLTPHADERFVEHELVESLFQKIATARHGSHEWKGRLSVLGDLMRRHTETEEGGLFLNLSERYAADELVEMGTQFMLARDKLTLLEEAKRAA